MENKNLIMYVFAIFLLTFIVLVGLTDFNLLSIATDSGFDTSYDSGSSSSSSSSSSWSSSGSSSSSSESGDMFGLEENLGLGFTFLMGFIVMIFIDQNNKKKWIIYASLTVLLAIVRLLVLLLFIIAAGVMLVFLPSLYIKAVIDNVKQKKKRKQSYLEKTEENKKILEEGYQIFVDVQKAWMDFDYDKLRELVTDELYNTYYNQLQTLSIKGQKNVMHDFELVRYDLVNKVNYTNSTTVIMELEVKFYDYITDSKGKCIRGNKNTKVQMLYQLTFVYNKDEITICPNCGGNVYKKDLKCEYCNTKIIDMSGNMRLSTKKCLKQK